MILCSFPQLCRQRIRTKTVAVRHSKPQNWDLTGFCYCSSLLSVAVTRTLTKTNLKTNLGWVCYCLLQVVFYHLAKQGQELKGGTEVEAMRGTAYWLASYGLLSLLFLYHPGVSPPIVDWTLPLLLSDTLASFIKKSPTGLLTGSLLEATSQLGSWFPDDSELYQVGK